MSLLSDSKSSRLALALTTTAPCSFRLFLTTVDSHCVKVASCERESCVAAEDVYIVYCSRELVQNCPAAYREKLLLFLLRANVRVIHFSCRAGGARKNTLVCVNFQSVF